jgi:hypothetical protein
MDVQYDADHAGRTKSQTNVPHDLHVQKIEPRFVQGYGNFFKLHSYIAFLRSI